VGPSQRIESWKLQRKVGSGTDEPWVAARTQRLEWSHRRGLEEVQNFNEWPGGGVHSSLWVGVLMNESRVDHRRGLEEDQNFNEGPGMGFTEICG
jgi:hypothetical protein